MITHRWILGAVALTCFSSASAQSVTDVKLQKIGEGVEVQVKGKDLAKPKVISLYGGKSLVLEFSASLGTKPAYERVRSGGVQYLNYALYSAKPAKTRVHVRLSKAMPATLASNGSGWSLSVNAPISSLSTKNAIAPAVVMAHFPDTVPPLEKPQVMASTATAPVVTPAETPNLQRRVTLDFVNTDIVQILKALAMQANVNIVTSPEVKGSLTVSLDGVTVTEALDLVTALGGMRYAKSGSSFVVTTTERFSNAMRLLGGNRDEQNETRIVSINSGEGAQIKASILKAMSQDNVLGRYEILLPTEVLKVESVQQSSSNANQGAGDPKAGDKGANTDKSAQQVSSTTETGSSVTARPKDFYVVLIGLPKRLDEVEKMVKEIDSRISEVSKVSVGKGLDTIVVPCYSGRIAEVANSVRKIVERDPKRELYNVQESNTGQVTSEEPVPLLLITGPMESIAMIERFARGVDESLATASGLDYPKTALEAERAYEVLDLKYVEPLEAAIELQNRVKGLRATMLPAPVSPSAQGSRSVSQGSGAAKGGSSSSGSSSDQNSQSSQGSGRNSNTNNVEDQGSSKNQSGGGANSGQSSGGEANANQGDKVSLTKTLGSEPMKLLVRGTRSQITLAKKYLDMFDLPPRQVALELRVLELTKEDAMKFGLDWSLLSGGKVSTIRVNQGVGLTSGSAGSISGKQVLGGNRGAFDVIAALDDLSTGVRLIARPNMIASEGRPTNIFIGDEIRYVETVQTTQNGTTVTTGKVEVGVRFTVTPRVGSEGNLTLELSPELSLLKGFIPVPGGGQLPQTSVRSTNSVVNIKSGETLAIGGLIQDLDRKSIGGVPILKDIPILGALFRREDVSKSRSEVVFFLTARTVTPEDRKSAADPRESEKRNPAELPKGKG